MRSRVPGSTVLLALLTCLTSATLTGAPTAAAPAAHAAAQAAGTTKPLIPLPVVAEDRAGGPFTLSPSLAVVAPGAAAPVGSQLAAQLRRSTGFQVPVVSRASGPAVRITVDPAAAYTVEEKPPTPESYVLDVAADGVRIVARTAHGAYNGVQTLRQLLPAWAEAPVAARTGWQVAPIHIEDAPRFSYRGVMLDVARSFQDVDEVKRYIDVLSTLKMNVLHLHLADDQGWRIEITNEGKAPGDPIDYSALTRESGITAMAQQGYRRELGRSGYYTQAQYRDIVAYARDRFVTVVPEVDVPGHTNAALHAIPQLNTDRSLPARDPKTGVVDWNGTGSVGYSALDEKLELSYKFIEHVFSQLADLTGGPYVHLGGDESHAMGHSRYVEFVTKAVPRLQAATGVGTMGWTEYAEAGLSQGPGYWNGSVIQYWVGSGDWVRDFVAKGGKAVVSAAGGSYLDQKYSRETPIGLSWACSGACDFQKYYSWDPTTTISGGVPEAGILGVEGPLWSETVRGGDQAGFLTMPRAAAILETGWTPAAKKDVTAFGARLGRLGPHLTVAGSNYYESAGTTWSASVAGTDVTARSGATSTHAVGMVAAPGTKLSADGGQLVPDTTSTDGDPASRSALTAPLTAELTCGRTSLPVRFGQQQGRDALHGAGTYTATVTAAFSRDTECVLTPSAGDPVPIRVRATDGDNDSAATSRDHQPQLSIGTPGQPVRAGTWVPLHLTGFAPGYVDIQIDGTTVYTVRPGANGEFHRTGVVPAATYDGSRTFSAVQGNRSASTVVDVESELKPLPDLIDQSTLSVHDVDSEETVGEDGAAANAIDGNPDSIWHTEWLNAQPGFPHHITLDLGKAYDVTGLQYLQRQNGRNTRIKDYRIAVSADGSTWIDAASGSFAEVLTPQNVQFGAVRGRYVRLTGLNSHPGNAYGGAAEINIGGVPAP